MIALLFSRELDRLARALDLIRARAFWRRVIVVDNREPADIVARLEALGVPVAVKQICPGDYVVGEVAGGRERGPGLFSSPVQTRPVGTGPPPFAADPPARLPAPGELTPVSA